MLQTSINNVKILQRSSTLHLIVLLTDDKITVTEKTGKEKQTSRLDLVKESVNVLKLK